MRNTSIILLILAMLLLPAFAALLVLTVLLQILGGAYRSEFGGQPDEPVVRNRAAAGVVDDERHAKPLT